MLPKHLKKAVENGVQDIHRFRIKNKAQRGLEDLLFLLKNEDNIKSKRTTEIIDPVLMDEICIKWLDSRSVTMWDDKKVKEVERDEVASEVGERKRYLLATSTDIK